MKGVPQLSLAHAASEAFIGMNIKEYETEEITPRYTLCLPLAFFEFLPIEEPMLTYEEKKKNCELDPVYPEKVV